MAFKDIHCDSVVLILSYLSARDVGINSMVDKLILSRERVSSAIREVCKTLLCSPNENEDPIFTPATYYKYEYLSIKLALNFKKPLARTGYWISTSWVTAARKGYAKNGDEILIDASDRSMKQSINDDITCIHGALKPSKGLNGMRKLIEAKYWKYLRRYYPGGAQFKWSDGECAICSNQAKQESKRVTLPPMLEKLYSRKGGVPKEAIAAENPNAVEQSQGNPYPLVPGLYNVIPRKWMRQWRQFVRDPAIHSIPFLDCTGFLCIAHKELVIPPSLQNYLLGTVDSLVDSAQYVAIEHDDGVEIIKAEEWDFLQNCYRECEEFGIRFSIDHDHTLNWNLDVCTQCHPQALKMSNRSPRF